MGLADVQFNVLHQLILGLGLEQAWAVYVAVGAGKNPIRVDGADGSGLA
jgi:hypothetical protein